MSSQAMKHIPNSIPDPDGELFPFDWRGRRFYYAPYHHRIFDSPRVPALRRPFAQMGRREVDIGTIWLNVSGSCNLQCRYCFAPQAGASDASMMTPEVAQSAVAMLSRLWQMGSQRQPARIIFFGGEPLLNRKVILRTIHFSRAWGCAHGIPFAYSLATNATLLTAGDLGWIRREQLTVYVSLDGPQAVHDRHRLFHNGQGSFAKTIANSRTLLAFTPDQVSVRATLAAGTCEFAEVMDFLTDQGFRSVSIKVMNDNNRSGVAPAQPDLHQMHAGLDRAVDSLLRANRRGVQCAPFFEHLTSLRTGRYRPFTCGAGSSALCVAPSGEVYPCHRFLDDDHYRVGHVTGPLDMNVCAAFANLVAQEMEECRRCWAVKLSGDVPG